MKKGEFDKKIRELLRQSRKIENHGKGYFIEAFSEKLELFTARNRNFRIMPVNGSPWNYEYSFILKGKDFSYSSMTELVDALYRKLKKGVNNG